MRLVESPEPFLFTLQPKAVPTGQPPSLRLLPQPLTKTKAPRRKLRLVRQD